MPTRTWRCEARRRLEKRRRWERRRGKRRRGKRRWGEGWERRLVRRWGRRRWERRRERKRGARLAPERKRSGCSLTKQRLWTKPTGL